MNITNKIWSWSFIIALASACIVCDIRADESEDESEGIDAHHLVTPHLAPSDIIECKIGLRPYRKSGVRLEVEPMGPKTLVHNYGHGGSGLSLSWGCADVTVDLMQQELRRLKRQMTKNIAVVGAGVIGLTTAYILLSKGYKVTIYARDFTPNTTSDIATGIVVGNFHVAAGSKPGDQERLDRAKTISLAKFKELVAAPSPEIKGVSFADFYSFDTNLETMQKDWLHELISDIKTVSVHFDTGITRKALYCKNIVIDTPVYMNDLFMKVHAMGAVVKHQVFWTIDELLALPEKVIFNCMGLGSTAVLDDQDLVPLKGAVVYVKPRDGINYVLHAQTPGTPESEFISYRQWSNCGIVGGTLIEDDWNDFPDQETSDKLMNNLRKFVAFPKGTSHFPAA